MKSELGSSVSHSVVQRSKMSTMMLIFALVFKQ